MAYPEAPDHTGKAPCHKDAALRAEARGACNKPTKKGDYQENVGHQSNVRYRGYQIDYTLRKERGMNRYAGTMIIYSDDLKFMVRSTLDYLPDNSIQHVFKVADEILKARNMGDSKIIDERSRQRNKEYAEKYKATRNPRKWKKVGESRFQNTQTGMVVGIEKTPSGGYLAFGQMPNRPSFDLYDVNNGEEWANREDVERELKDWMKGCN